MPRAHKAANGSVGMFFVILSPMTTAPVQHLTLNLYISLPKKKEAGLLFAFLASLGLTALLKLEDFRALKASSLFHREVLDTALTL